MIETNVNGPLLCPWAESLPMLRENKIGYVFLEKVWELCYLPPNRNKNCLLLSDTFNFQVFEAIQENQSEGIQVMVPADSEGTSVSSLEDSSHYPP